MPDNRKTIHEIQTMARRMRKKVLDMALTAGAGSSHFGGGLSIVDITATLFGSIMKLDPKNPEWEYRDRFILSKGHGCLALYAILADKGFIPKSELTTFCDGSSRLGGHPEIKVPGVEASTGSLGHGLPIGVGIALAGKIRKQSYRVGVVVGDGEINEGSVWEAAMSSSKHKLSNLTVFVDYNKLQSYGPTQEVMDLEPLFDKWSSFGFETKEVDGHDVVKLERVIADLPFQSNKPSALICHTVKGKGFGIAEGLAEWHHKSNLSEQQITELYKCLE